MYIYVYVIWVFWVEMKHIQFKKIHRLSSNSSLGGFLSVLLCLDIQNIVLSSHLRVAASPNWKPALLFCSMCAVWHLNHPICGQRHGDIASTAAYEVLPISGIRCRCQSHVWIKECPVPLWWVSQTTSSLSCNSKKLCSGMDPASNGTACCSNFAQGGLTSHRIQP